MTHVAFDTVSRLLRLMYIRAYVLPADGRAVRVIDVRVTLDTPVKTSFAVSTAPGAEHNLYVEIYGMADANINYTSLALTIVLEGPDGRETLDFDYDEVDKRTVSEKYTVMQTWGKLMQNDDIKTVVDIGGRARSGISRKDAYPGKRVEVADIMNAPDVDLVADVHELSRHATRKFDAFVSIATFEHLLMPWKAAIEINRTIVPGAIGLVVTHQTVGLHELPWDFFRFSNTAWKGIFNRYTGFEIVDSGMTGSAMIIPRQWRPEFNDTEHAVGYLTSAVVVRKISEPKVEWPVEMSVITADMYPQ